MILGTAGHIDHGKTALVKALTGVDTDRLPEEKRRGITIDLGFAPLQLDGVETIGIVDVPGHEAFVRTMLAGASGIDIAMLVVAADEGVMPQTREHLQILSLLSVPRAVVALTKCDLVSQEWLALVTEEVTELLAGTALEASPIVPVSAVTGAGLTELRDAIRSAAISAGGRGGAVIDDVFRMPVDRAFTVKGTGTVVTGTVWSGAISREASVTVFPPGTRSRVRGIQHHSAPVKVAGPGERVALALSDLEVSEIRRGSVVVTSASWKPTSTLEVEVTLLDRDFVLTPRTRLRFHLGTSDVGARISRVEASVADERESDGSESEFVAMVKLDEPLLIRGGDRFVLRRPSPAATVGGGIVRDPFPAVRRRGSSRKTKVATDGSDAHQRRIGESSLDLLKRMAHEAALDGLQSDLLPIRLGTPRAQSAALSREAGLVEIDSWLHEEQALSRLESSVERAIAKHVENFPLESGVQLQSVRAAAGARDAVFDWVIARLVSGSRIELHGSVAKPAGWSSELSDRHRGLADGILHEICIQPSEPPSVAELVSSFGEATSALLRYLERAGELVRVSDDRYYSPQAVESMVGTLRSRMEPGRVYAATELKEILGVSRKYLIPFLEFCDLTGVTGSRSDERGRGRVIVESGSVQMR
jgi:selenocysteine-specific elongation factor